MDRDEPTFVPEWLKNGGSASGGWATTHQIASSSSQSDHHVLSKPARNKSLANRSDRDKGRPFVLDRTSSSYFSRSSSSTNGSPHSRPFSSFSRSSCDRDWEKDMHDSCDKEKSILGDHWMHDYSDHLGVIFPPRFEKEVLRRSQSMTPGKQGEVWPRKLASDSSNANKKSHNNGKGVLPGSTDISSGHKNAFERDFPSLGGEERQATPEIGRVSSPGLSTAIQSLSIGASPAIGGDGWTSALAEVPVMVGNTSTGGSVSQAVPATSVSASSGVTGSLNMAETLAHGPSRSHTTFQSSAGIQRLEELAIKKSRQLVPMTPSTPKTLVLNPLEKPKPKIGSPQQQRQIASSHLVNHSLRGGPTKSDVSKTSSGGKLHVLKPARERNGVSPTARDSSSPTSVSKIANSPLAVTPVVRSAPLGSPVINPNLASSEHKPSLTTLEKRPTSQAQSRSDFFNLMRKKSMTNTSVVPGSGSAVSVSELGKSDESEADTAIVTPQGGDACLSDTSVGDWSNEKSCDMICNSDVSDTAGETLNNGKNHLNSDSILYSEEEEAAFLRSLGWEENAGEDEGLTEEEINTFYRNINEYIKSKPSSRILQGTRPKCLVPLNLHMESVSGGASSGFSSSDSKMES